MDYSPAKYGFLMLGLAWLLGVLCMLIVEKTKSRLERSGGRDITGNIRVGRRAIQQQKDQQAALLTASLYHDPRIDALIQDGKQAEALALAQSRFREAFEANNEDLTRLYRKYVESLGAQGNDHAANN